MEGLIDDLNDKIKKLKSMPHEDDKNFDKMKEELSSEFSSIDDRLNNIESLENKRTRQSGKEKEFKKSKNEKRKLRKKIEGARDKIKRGSIKSAITLLEGAKKGAKFSSKNIKKLLNKIRKEYNNIKGKDIESDAPYDPSGKYDDLDESVGKTPETVSDIEMTDENADGIIDAIVEKYLKQLENLKTLFEKYNNSTKQLVDNEMDIIWKNYVKECDKQLSYDESKAKELWENSKLGILCEEIYILVKEKDGQSKNIEPITEEEDRKRASNVLEEVKKRLVDLGLDVRDDTVGKARFGKGGPTLFAAIMKAINPETGMGMDIAVSSDKSLWSCLGGRVAVPAGTENEFVEGIKSYLRDPQYGMKSYQNFN